MAEKILIELDVDASGAVKSVTKLNKEVEDTGSGLKKTSKGVEGFGKKLKALGAAAGVIGLLATAFLTLKKAFASSEEGQNKLQKFFTIIESITGNLLTTISDLTMDFIALFENPQQAIKDFANLIKDNIVNRFEGLIELIPQLGKAVQQLFEGDFSGAAKTAVNAAAKVSLGVEDIVGKTEKAIDATKRYVDEIVKEAEVAGGIADKRAQADKRERALLVERAEANRKIAELRERAADKENVSVQDRIKAIEEAGQIEAEITAKEVALAKLRLAAKQEENALSNSAKEDLLEEAQLKAQVIEAETSALKLQKALTAELTTAKREAAAEEKRINDEKAAEEKRRNDEKIEEEKRVAAEQAKLREQKEKADKQAADSAIKLKKAEEDAKFNLASVAAGAVIELAGESSAIGKLAAVSQAVINTYQGVTAALAQTTDVTPTQTLRFANAAAVGIAGALNVKKILSTKTIGNSGGGGGAPSVSTPSAATVTAPSFITQSDTGVNQLGDTISSAINNKPVQAYVTQTDIDNNAQLSRNTQNNAQF